MKQIVVIFLCLFATTIQSKEGHHKKRHHKAHEHGSGKLNLATDGNKLVIKIEAPANDIVGFEHKPSTKEQRNKINSAIKFLKVASSNLQLPRASGCKPEGSSKIKAKMAEGEHEEGHEEEGHHKDEEHSEFHISYTFTCSNIESLNYVKVLSFKKFKGMKKLKAQGVTKTGQFSKTLNSKSPQFDLRK
ncbi:MAG: DUF2796 domain-containing protein [Oligoflexia bacterium]|nr:DUF2796 domain-containing protein [Oligoflexia bacterium]